jgi:hypothetical protein
LTLVRHSQLMKGCVEATPQQKVWIGKFHRNLDRLRFSMELVGPGNEMTLVRILVAGRQDEVELTLLGRLLDACECLTALEISRGRRSTDRADRIQLGDRGESALVARLLGGVRAFLD